MNPFTEIAAAMTGTLRDVLPIGAVVAVFQVAVLRRPIVDLPRVLVGFACVIVGLSIFLVGLEAALFPLGEAMAQQLAHPAFLGVSSAGEMASGLAWYRYGWTYVFAFSIGVSTTIAEPALIAVALKAAEVSGGSIHPFALRVAVAVGAGFGVALGAFRIVSGVPLPYFILAGYLVVIVQTYFAPRQIVPLAYDSGGVTTSTVTVPLVAALGLGLAANIPGRDPLVDGFGMIALTALFPIVTVMGYAQLAAWWTRRRPSR